uniref:Reverse transcriptase zinc-binding domain-containing protein n=1 Tax=Gossypium raimondii TaxID=29730 RepID=A0A0D2V2F5_GOSRA|nr:hypothetical protein B456_012G058800 [Gossypium raimondii]
MTAEWQLLCPQRVKVFLWLPFQNKLLANRIRVHRHIAIDARFVACGDPIESIDHILCFLLPGYVHEFLNSPFAEWLDVNITDPSRFPFDSNNWDCFFAALCWCIWKQQNRGIFDVDSVVGGCLIHQTRRLWANSRALTIVHWIKLNISWLKVNTEGARNEQFECAVDESAVQNHDGVWIAGCARNIDACSVLEISKDQILTN